MDCALLYMGVQNSPSHTDFISFVYIPTSSCIAEVTNNSLEKQGIKLEN